MFIHEFQHDLIISIHPVPYTNQRWQSTVTYTLVEAFNFDATHKSYTCVIVLCSVTMENAACNACHTEWQCSSGSSTWDHVIGSKQLPHNWPCPRQIWKQHKNDTFDFVKGKHRIPLELYRWLGTVSHGKLRCIHGCRVTFKWRILKFTR